MSIPGFNYAKFTLFLIFLFSLTAFGKNAKQETQDKVEDLLSKMTLEEKVGQMTQVTIQTVSAERGWIGSKHQLDPKKLEHAIVEKRVGSILNVYDMANTIEHWHEIITQIQNVATKKTRLGIPIIYGIDAIHGANYTLEATLFPQAIAMAATRNPELMKKSAEITAYEVRASGIPWNFNPVLGVGRQPLWSRLFETFGEDPYLVSVMGEAYIKGSEGENNNLSAPDKVAACMKHYLGYSVPLSGKDRTPAWIPERMLRNYFLPPFKRAVKAGVHTVMVNSSEINGIPVHSDHYLLTEILKEELNFQGFVVSDWEDIKRLYDRDMVAHSPKEAVRMAVMAGVDMSMVPYDFSFYDHLVALVKEGAVPQSRIDDAVRRILSVKFELGLFENPFPDKSMAKNVGSKASWEESLKAAREAMTLLKNDEKLLPLKKDQKVLVTGPNANLHMVLNSGWTYTWQGDQEAMYPKDKPTILTAIQQKIGKENVTYFPGTTYDKPVDIQAAVEAAKTSDVAIVCIGEMPYCETPGNIHDLNLPQVQLDLVAAIQETGTPVVLVLVEGRPRVITPVVEKTAAILMAYLPGPQGGSAIADVVFGDFNPCGKLPFTYPRNANDLVCYDHKPIEIDDPNKLNPLFEFGYGLSYTQFEYEDLTLVNENVEQGQPLEIRVTVKNSGSKSGKEIVELYLSDMVRSISPPVRQLKRFTGVYLKPGEHKTVQFTLNDGDLAFYNRENKYVIEPGEFKISIGGLSKHFTVIQPME